jgi:hypothetical protein
MPRKEDLDERNEGWQRDLDTGLESLRAAREALIVAIL